MTAHDTVAFLALLASGVVGALITTPVRVAIAAFLALLASGVVGALITTPVRIAITVAAKRTSSDRRR